ncbi:MAG: leucyl aminopeptidase [Polyangiaceae bacterium]|nr:leucyl aminopeptidase [Polyangiaceae bacterium]
MQMQLAVSDVIRAEADVLVVPVTEGALGRQRFFASIDAALGGTLTRLAEAQEFQGKAEQTLELATLGRLPAVRVVLVGLGSRRGHDAATLRTFAAVAARSANGLRVRSMVLGLPDKTAGSELRHVAEGLVLGAYRFTKYLTGDRAPKQTLERVDILRPAGKVTAAERRGLEIGIAVGEAVSLARDAVNEPANELSPAGLAALAIRIAKVGRLKVIVLDKKGILAKGMKLHYAVGQGSVNEPRFIHMTYIPKKRARERLVFVGKGLTFDSGGLSIKPAAGMGDMKTDMGGAAAVLGLMAAVAAVEPAVEVHGIIGAAENMPDGGAYRPGDVFGSLDGKTVEIVNTDAEGRLVLADALAYAARLEPDLIVDAATLTGACMVALGKSCTGYFATADGIARRLERAAALAGEQMWRLPLADDQREQLKSDIADLKHTGERWGGAITAALFLREFTAGHAWIHCDIAGPALSDRATGVIPKGGTGHGVLTFLALVEGVS